MSLARCSLQRSWRFSFVLGGRKWPVIRMSKVPASVSTGGCLEFPHSMEAPMKYLLLIYQNPGSREIWESFSDAERAEGLQAYAALNEELAASGELIATEALADASQAKRVTVQEGQAITSDGPFAEVKEQLAGFYLV